jgi:hypothetical protein
MENGGQKTEAKGYTRAGLDGACGYPMASEPERSRGERGSNVPAGGKLRPAYPREP